MKLKYIILGGYCLFAFAKAYAQEIPLDEAVKSIQSSNPEYIDAIEIYEKVIEEGRIEDPALFIKIARAYYFNGNYESANKWFDKYYNSYEVQPLPIYNYWYGQTLKALENYEKADSLLGPFYENKGERYVYTDNKSSFIKENLDRYDMLSFDHNTESSDYSAFLQQDRLYFIASAVKGEKSRKTDVTTTDVFFTDDTIKQKEQPDGELNSEFNEGSLVVTKDGNTMYFTRNAFLNNKYKKSKRGEDRVVSLNIYRAELIGGKWQNIKPSGINSPNYSVGHPALSPDEKTLYFSSDMPGGKGGPDLYSVPVKSNGSLGKPVNLEAINTLGKEMFPFVDGSTGILYFSSDRPSSLGGMDVFTAELEEDGTYQKAYNIGKTINSSYDDFGYMINKSSKGYFSSNRGGDVVKDDIYSFFEKQPFPFPIMLSIAGVTTDIETNEIVTGVSISLVDVDGKVLETVLSDAEGKYTFTKANVATVAFVRIEKNGYLTSEISLEPKKLAKKNPSLDIRLVPVEAGLSEMISITGKITDATVSSLDAGLPAAAVTFYDINGATLATVKTDKDGNYNLDAVNRRAVAFMRVEKQGYLIEEVLVNGNKVKGDSIQENVTLSTSQIAKEEGADISSILNTIYFDSGKSVIREDAKIELEKIVQVLNQYEDINILIGSHTDSRSSSNFNLKLSQQRAKATYNYLISRGLEASRLSHKGFGETQLINKCSDGVSCTDEENQLNRRSTFTIEK